MKALMKDFRIHKSWLWIVLLNSIFGFAQNVVVPDSLLQKEYAALETQFYVLGDRNPKAEVYAQAYLKKGKQENDTLAIIKGYHLLSDMKEKDYEKSTALIDSAIVIGKGIKHHYYPAGLYGKKAYIERLHGNFKASLDNRLKEMELLKEKGNETSINYANYNIALLKRELGYYEDAKTLFKECLKYDEKYVKKYPKDSSGYLITTSELVTTYRLNQQLDSALILNNSQMKTAKNNGFGFMYELNAGIINYNLKKYEQAISQIESAIPELFNKQNENVYEPYHQIDAYLYLGKSYEALSKNVKKLVYYKKLDSMIASIGYFVPESKDVYLQLIEHYKKLGDKTNQLLYIDKLIYADSILDGNFRYLNNRINKDYDIPKLMDDKEEVIAEMTASNKKKTYTTVLVSMLLGLSILGGCYFYYKQRTYKNRFKKLLNESTEKRPVKIVPVSEVPKETVDNILNELQKFEARLDFLKPNMTSNKLAKTLGTNSKYLSIVMNTHQEKSLSQYINDLRIDYGIEKLKSDSTFRKYSIKAIANDLGFNTAEAFSKAFQKKTGILPSYFIKELIKTKK